MKDSNCFKMIINMLTGSTLVLVILVGIAVLARGPSAHAGAAGPMLGSGTLAINPAVVQNYCTPPESMFMDYHTPSGNEGFWDIKQGEENHLNITAGLTICKGGDPAEENMSCSNDNQCNTNAGNQCQKDSTGVCTEGDTSNTSCTKDNDCDISGECLDTGFCNTSPFGDCTRDNQCNDVDGTCDIKSHCISTSPNNPGEDCTTGGNDFCNYVDGKCVTALECTDTKVVISGHTSTACTEDSQCGGTTCNKTCDDGPNVGQFCDTDDDCNPGSSTNNHCNQEGLCKYEDMLDAEVTTKCTNNGNTCEMDSDCDPGLCVPVEIDACFPTPSNICSFAEVSYCDGYLVNGPVPENSQTLKDVSLRTVADEDEDTCTTATEDEDCGEFGTCVDINMETGMGVCDSPLLTSEACGPEGVATCTNEPTSYCCGLTQGAYGAPKSVATAQGDCGSTNLGYIRAAQCMNPTCDVFAGGCPGNATTIGDENTNYVSLLDLDALFTWLPAGGKAGDLKTPSKCFSTDPFLPNDLTGGGSKGYGSGVLGGQTEAAQLNAFLSDECGVGPTGGVGEGFTASGFGSFTLPGTGELICTQRSGPNKALGDTDDICEAFGYPDCVAGLMVSDVLDCANYYLAHGNDGNNPYCSCSAADLNKALSNINVEFDQCGYVIECPGGQQPGIIMPCPPAG